MASLLLLLTTLALIIPNRYSAIPESVNYSVRNESAQETKLNKTNRTTGANTFTNITMINHLKHLYNSHEVESKKNNLSSPNNVNNSGKLATPDHQASANRALIKHGHVLMNAANGPKTPVGKTQLSKQGTDLKSEFTTGRDIVLYDENLSPVGDNDVDRILNINGRNEEPAKNQNILKTLSHISKHDLATEQPLKRSELAPGNVSQPAPDKNFGGIREEKSKSNFVMSALNNSAISAMSILPHENSAEKQINKAREAAIKSAVAINPDAPGQENPNRSTVDKEPLENAMNVNSKGLNNDPDNSVNYFNISSTPKTYSSLEDQHLEKPNFVTKHFPNTKLKPAIAFPQLSKNSEVIQAKILLSKNKINLDQITHEDEMLDKKEEIGQTEALSPHGHHQTVAEAAVSKSIPTENFETHFEDNNKTLAFQTKSNHEDQSLTEIKINASHAEIFEDPPNKSENIPTNKTAPKSKNGNNGLPKDNISNTNRTNKSGMLRNDLVERSNKSSTILLQLSRILNVAKGFNKPSDSNVTPMEAKSGRTTLNETRTKTAYEQAKSTANATSPLINSSLEASEKSENDSTLRTNATKLSLGVISNNIGTRQGFVDSLSKKLLPVNLQNFSHHLRNINEKSPESNPLLNYSGKPRINKNELVLELDPTSETKKVQVTKSSNRTSSNETDESSLEMKKKTKEESAENKDSKQDESEPIINEKLVLENQKKLKSDKSNETNLEIKVNFKEATEAKVLQTDKSKPEQLPSNAVKNINYVNDNADGELQSQSMNLSQLIVNDEANRRNRIQEKVETKVILTVKSTPTIDTERSNGTITNIEGTLQNDDSKLSLTNRLEDHINADHYEAIVSNKSLKIEGQKVIQKKIISGKVIDGTKEYIGSVTSKEESTDDRTLSNINDHSTLENHMKVSDEELGTKNIRDDESPSANVEEQQNILYAAGEEILSSLKEEPLQNVSDTIADGATNGADVEDVLNSMQRDHLGKTNTENINGTFKEENKQGTSIETSKESFQKAITSNIQGKSLLGHKPDSADLLKSSDSPQGGKLFIEESQQNSQGSSHSFDSLQEEKLIKDKLQTNEQDGKLQANNQGSSIKNFKSSDLLKEESLQKAFMYNFEGKSMIEDLHPNREGLTFSGERNYKTRIEDLYEEEKPRALPSSVFQNYYQKYEYQEEASGPINAEDAKRPETATSFIAKDYQEDSSKQSMFEPTKKIATNNAEGNVQALMTNVKSHESATSFMAKDYRDDLSQQSPKFEPTKKIPTNNVEGHFQVVMTIAHPEAKLNAPKVSTPTTETIFLGIDNNENIRKPDKKLKPSTSSHSEGSHVTRIQEIKQSSAIENRAASKPPPATSQHYIEVSVKAEAELPLAKDKAANSNQEEPINVKRRELLRSGTEGMDNVKISTKRIQGHTDKLEEITRFGRPGFTTSLTTNESSSSSKILNSDENKEFASESPEISMTKEYSESISLENYDFTSRTKEFSSTENSSSAGKLASKEYSSAKSSPLPSSTSETIIITKGNTATKSRFLAPSIRIFTTIDYTDVSSTPHAKDANFNSKQEDVKSPQNSKQEMLSFSQTSTTNQHADTSTKPEAIRSLLVKVANEDEDSKDNNILENAPMLITKNSIPAARGTKSTLIDSNPQSQRKSEIDKFIISTMNPFLGIDPIQHKHYENPNTSISVETDLETTTANKAEYTSKQSTTILKTKNGFNEPELTKTFKIEGIHDFNEENTLGQSTKRSPVEEIMVTQGQGVGSTFQTDKNVTANSFMDLINVKLDGSSELKPGNNIKTTSNREVPANGTSRERQVVISKIGEDYATNSTNFDANRYILENRSRTALGSNSTFPKHSLFRMLKVASYASKSKLYPNLNKMGVELADTNLNSSKDALVPTDLVKLGENKTYDPGKINLHPIKKITPSAREMTTSAGGPVTTTRFKTADRLLNSRESRPSPAVIAGVRELKPSMIKRSRPLMKPHSPEPHNDMSTLVTAAASWQTTSVSPGEERATNLLRDQTGKYTTNGGDYKGKEATTRFPQPRSTSTPEFPPTIDSLQVSSTAVTQFPNTLQSTGDAQPETSEDNSKETQINLNLPAGAAANTSAAPNKFDFGGGECLNCSANVGARPKEATDNVTTLPILTTTGRPEDHFLFTESTVNISALQDRLQDYLATNKPQYTDGALLMTPNSDNENAGTNSTVKFTNWPVKKEAVVEGDIVLGGLMMVHEREDSITCGPVMPQGGIQALEAMLYTLDRLNEERTQLLPNITLGAHILDDCDKDTYGLEMAVDFIKGSISNIDGAEYSCNKTQVRKVISGVVGAASSVTSIQVANLLRLFKIPQVSFFSTSPELSNKQRFEYFTRTIPSDHYQVKAMVDIIKMLGWSYVSIIYEESNYGIKAFEELEDLLAEYNICIAVKEKLVKDSGVADESAYDNIVQKLLTKPRARGAIIFGSDQEVAGVMRAVRRNNATGSFSWIGSDGWSARSLVSDGNEAEVEGTLSVQPQANPVIGFEEYFLNLTVENNKRNPWFVEFWEHHFQCYYPNSSKTPYNLKYTTPCTGKETLSKQNTVFEDQLQFVSDAVMAFGYAIRDMHQHLCHGRPGLCDAMKPTKGTELLKYLRKVHFEGLSGDRFRFDQNGDGPARYNIIHFKQLTPGKYRWIRVGEYIEGELRLNMSEIQFKLGHPKPPESVCSLPCDLGQAKKYVEGESCCWHCFNCTQYQIRHKGDPTQCTGCPPGTVPDPQHIRCVDIPEEYLQPDSGWAIGAMALSTTGILITMCVCGVFIRHNDTPVVRASGRELSYVLLAGIFMCYCVTYALVLRPSDIVCGIQRFGAGFCFTVVYAALLTKTNRISRIFNAGKRSAKRPSFISPRSQLIICSGLVGVQLIINGVWMVISPARAIYHHPTREDNLLVCSSYIDASYMIAFSYPILLIVVCTIYAVLTRKIPEAFNESKHIGFTMYTTCVIWLAFVPLYFGTANHVALRITSMSVTISLSASVTVACLFSPKLYIILIRPERNVRQSMMPMRYSAINKSTTATTNSGAGSMMAAVMVTAATCNQKNQIQKHVPSGEILEKEETDISDKVKPSTKDSSTQTNPPISTNNSSTNSVMNNTEDHLPKINNNCNGPLAIVQGAQIKDLPL